MGKGLVDAQNGNLSAIANMQTFLIVGIIGLILCVLGLGTFARIGWMKDFQVYLCDHGFIYAVHNDSPQPFRWDQIQVWRSVKKLYYKGSYESTTYMYTVQRLDGHRVRLTNSLKNVKSLGEILCDQVTRRLLPQAIQSYNVGQTISFGPLSLNQEGISDDTQTLPWAQVEAVEVRNGMIHIKQQGRWFRWSNVTASAIPNLFIFLTLVDYVQKSYGKC